MPTKTAMVKQIVKNFFAPIVLLLITASSLADNWHELAPGIEYKDLGTSLISPWSHIHTFKVSLQKNKVELALAKAFARPFATADEFAHQTKASIAINGGFFDIKHHPLGLRINNHQVLNPLKRISWWGVFYIKDQIPHISSLKHFKQDDQIEFAVQSGPRLLVNGKIPSLKPGIAERSALGITKDNQLIILVTENKPISTTELAQIMKSPPLNCDYAINLDGGSSSQLRANLGSFQINAQGFSNVSDAVVVKTLTH